MQLRRTQEFLCQEYDRGVQEWDHLVDGLCGGESDATLGGPEQDVDELSWIREVQDGSDWAERPEKLAPDELHRCSWCRKPSARPKRCLGCKVTM